MGDGKGGNLLDQLEDTLLQADLGMATTDDVLEEARFLREESTEIFSRDDIKALLRGKLLEALGPSTNNPTPLTIHFIMGANGMGKTTTIGKLAHRLKTESGQKVLLAACDTFRAGAVAQLEQWADRAQVDCFSPNESTNGPSAVLFGALDKAIKEDYNVLLVDTSGRLSNNDALTAELVKMKRVIQKRMSTKFDSAVKPIPNESVPHETLLVIDAAQGRMALDSAKQWDKEVGLSGLILTKLDGSAKGGSVVAVSRELGLPVKLVGVGEGLEDLRDFEPESFVDGLL
ncbi:signal recognition particle alpha, partial [Thalassiosira pseudonana CCMP1335]